MSGGVLLIGASGLAREVIAAGLADVVGIFDDDDRRHGTEVGGVPVIGGVGAAADRNEKLLVCVGPSLARRSVVTRLREAGVAADRFATFVARSAVIGAGSVVGAGAIVLDGVVVTADARIGQHVTVMPNCVVTHDDVLGDFVTLAAGVALGGGVHLGEAAYIGMNASIRQGVTVGVEAVIGMGSVLLDDASAAQTWAGVPARRLGERA